MEQNLKKTGLVNLVMLVIIGGAAAGLAVYSKTLTGETGLVFLGLGFLVAAISYFQMRLEESERLERLELEELAKERASASLFNITETEVLPARRAREQFERFFVPGFTFVLFLAQASVVYGLWRWLSKVTFAPILQPTIALSLFALFALVLFLLGKYSSSLAQLEGARLLRPGASYLLLGAYICFLTAAALAAVLMGFPNVDSYIAKALIVILALSAIENLVSLILEIYRPRVRGKVERVLYESRLVGLLARPEGLVTTAAQALDYQFGFKVSETWFYRFLEKALAWIILLQLTLLWLATSLVFISPGEQGLIERFGRPLAGTGVLEPGLHLKLPWPIDKVFRARTLEIQTFEIGSDSEEKHNEQQKTILWAVPHDEKELNLLVASREPAAPASTNNAAGGAPVDLLTVNIPVQYRVKDLRAWAYHHTDASNLLERIATREVVRYLVGVDLFEIMSSGRSQAAQDLQSRIQKAAEALELGVEITLVGLQDIHPPVKVARKFEEVNAASQENEAALHAAEGYRAKTLALAEADAKKKIHEAEADAVRRVVDAQARAAQFTNQVVAYNAAPDVYMKRAYLQALERGATNARKYLLLITNSQDVIIYNQEEKLRPDFLRGRLNPSQRGP